MSKKIIIINDFCHVNGGAAAVAIHSALALAARGHLVRFLGAVSPIDENLRNCTNVEIRCANLPTFLGSPAILQAAREGLWSGRAATFIREATSDLVGDEVIVHVHGWVKAFSPSIFPELRRRGFKVVITLHDYFLACPNGGFLDYRKSEICQRTPLSLACITCNCDSRSYSQKLWRVARGMIQTHALKLPTRCDGYIAVSNFALDRLRGHLGHSALTAVVRNPISTPCPVEPRGEVATDAPLLFVGRLSPEKGPSLLAEAAMRLGRPAVFLGDGPLRQTLMAKYPACQFPGWTGSRDVLAWMRRAALLVFPSLWYETNGLVVVEAKSQGLASVVARGTAAAEHVRHGETGWLFDMGSLDSLVDVISRALPAKHVERQAAGEYWADPWTSASHAAALEEFYQSVAGTSAQTLQT